MIIADRLVAWSQRIPEAAIPGIFASFAEIMDDVAGLSSCSDFGRPNAWSAAERALELLMKRTKGDFRTLSFQRLFSGGRALGWLTSVLRSEIFSHGHFGNRTEPEHRRILSPTEFAAALNMMLDRYRTASPIDLLRVPDLMSLLYCWKQGSGTDEAKEWVETQTETDAGLLAFLSRVRGWAASSEHGVYYPLKRRDLEQFLDYKCALQRVRRLASDTNAAPEDRRLAEELLVFFKQDQDYPAEGDETDD